MKNKLKVSVVISTYNRSQLLNKALLSLVTQTESLYEAIIVNNNSTDNTEEIAEKFVREYENFSLVYDFECFGGYYISRYKDGKPERQKQK